MIRITFLLLSWIFCLTVYGQSNIHVSERAPEINITDWVQNIPSDRSLDNKFIVLEFWATWCGPCIAAVPHMNKIQEKIHRKDILFISMTDEPVNKIKRTLEKVDFSSIVVSDQSRKTHIAFGDGKKGLEEYPMTVLIDNKGIIQWVGSPKQLTTALIQEFLEGTLKATHHFKKVKNPVDATMAKTIPQQAFSSQRLLELVKQPDQLHFFQMNTANSDSETGSMRVGNMGFFVSGLTISDIYKNIFDVDVMVDPEFDSIRYNLMYKTTRPDVALARAEEEILRVMGLEKNYEQIQSTQYQVSIQDESLLKPTLEQLFSSKSDADDKLIFTRYSIQKMIGELGDKMKLNMEFSGEDDSLYDFIISTESVHSMEESLKSYGLTWVSEKMETEVLRLLPIN